MAFKIWPFYHIKALDLHQWQQQHQPSTKRMKLLQKVENREKITTTKRVKLLQKVENGEKITATKK